MIKIKKGFLLLRLIIKIKSFFVLIIITKLQLKLYLIIKNNY